MYVKRKEYLIKRLERELKVLSNKARFIKEQCDDVIDLRKKKKVDVIELLKSRGYDMVDEDEEYKYLRKMTIESVEEENYMRLMKECEMKKKELDVLKKKTIENMWLGELGVLKVEYEKYLVDRKVKLYGLDVKKKKKVKVVSN